MMDAATRRTLRQRARAMLEANARLGIRAPEPGTEKLWLNVARPLTLGEDLRGRVVLIDFWTSCCINCLHVLAELDVLEQRFADRPFSVIGCHSAKFSEETRPAHVRAAVLREGVRHPVVLDEELDVWQRYAVRAWPTLVLVSPDGRVLAQVAGEGQLPLLEILVEEALALYADRAGALEARPLPLRPEREAELPGTLRYPGKLLADEVEGRLYIADSGHDRVVVTTLEGAFVRTWGGAGPGLEDGRGERARFRNPQGLALWRGALWVADTGNHTLRRVDLDSGEVTTVAGTGRPGHRQDGPRAAAEAELSSPWDLAPLEGALLVAMAGPHQLWRYDPEDRTIGPFAGTGVEARLDGELAAAAFAQPSGLSTDGRRVWVADSESSSVRVLDLERGCVETLAGGAADPGDLFQFGDEPGSGAGPRFQHPLGLALDARGDGERGALVVADSYNHRLKRLDPRSGEVTPLAGDGRPGAIDGPLEQARFREPGGLAVAGGKVWVADTSNHLVRVLDLARGRVSTLPLGSVPLPPAWEAHAGGRTPGTGALRLPPDTLEHGAVRARLASGDARLVLTPTLESGERLAPGAPSQLRVLHLEGLVGARKVACTVHSPRTEVELGVAGDGVLEVQLLAYVCGADGLCRMRGERWRLEVEEHAAGCSVLELGPGAGAGG